MRSFNTDLVVRMLDLVSAYFDNVVIDMPRTWFPWTETVLLGSNKLYIVAEMTVPCLRHTQRLIQAIYETAGKEVKPNVIVNRFEQRTFENGIKQADVEEILGEHFVGRHLQQLPAGAPSGRPRRAAAGDRPERQCHQRSEEDHPAGGGGGDGAEIALAVLVRQGPAEEGVVTSRFSTLQKRADAPARRRPSSRAPSNHARVDTQRPQAARGAGAGNRAAQKTSNRVLDARMRIHRMLLEEINLVALERLPKDEMRRQVHEFVSEKTREERMAINVAELDSLVDDIVDEMVGLGPLEPLLKDPDINDILINGHENCFVERKGKLQQVHIPFKDEAHLLRIINKIVAAVGRRVDESQPMVDARMLDGSRFNAAIRPVGVDGPLVSIRKFSKNKLGAAQAGRVRRDHPEHGRGAGGGRACPQDDDHLGRHRHRQDDHAQRAVGLHSRGRAADHHRGRGRAAIAAAACRAHGDASGQHRRPWRD